jgi:hypothetical protein
LGRAVTHRLLAPYPEALATADEEVDEDGVPATGAVLLPGAADR